MKHAQAAIEFVLITVAMMLLATGVFIASQATYVELQQERVDQQVHSVFEQLENEFIIAQLVGEGYEREIRLPQTLNGVTYSIDTRLNQTAQGRDELSIYLYNNQEYLYFIRTPINGTLSKGRNLLLGGDVVQVRPIIPSMNCVGHWGEILHTQNRTFWQEESPAPGEECVSQVRVCTDTELSGTYEYLSCTQTPLPPEEPDNCTLPDGSTLEHGQTSEWFYSDTEVTSPETCDGVQYTCTNGELDHDDTVYIHTSCVESVTTPSAPTINSIDRTHNEFTVHFSAPSSDGGSAITDYQYRINGGGWTSAGTTFSPITISSLTPYTTYTIDIRAVNAAGAGAISNAFPQTTHPYATGGTVTHLSGYRVHTFTAVGTNTLTFQGGGGPVEYLIVAGGGGGGPENGGGGGGGGVRTGTVSATAGSHSIIVGFGGSGGSRDVRGNDNRGGNGGDSSALGITSIGGGGGGDGDSAGFNNGLVGGSGGGGGREAGSGASGTSGQGNNGGSGMDGHSWGVSYHQGGGGGGAASNGGSGVWGQQGVGVGGSGVASSISGSSVVYGGGGGGGIRGTGMAVSVGGSGGGGNGGAGTLDPVDGTNNRGGGGGGNGRSANGGTLRGANGGSGIVIIRYAR